MVSRAKSLPAPFSYQRLQWLLSLNCGGKHFPLSAHHLIYLFIMVRVGQNRIYAPYMTVYFVIYLPKSPYIHRIYMALANPNYCTPYQKAPFSLIGVGVPFPACVFSHVLLLPIVRSIATSLGPTLMLTLASIPQRQ